MQKWLRVAINIPMMPVNIFDITLLIAWFKKEWPFDEAGR